MAGTNQTRPGGFRAAWRHRRWRWLLASFTVSMTGDFLYFVALVTYLLDRTGSAGWVAGASMARVMAYVVLGPVGGAVASRVHRQRLMLNLDLARFALMLVMAAVVWGQGPPVVVVGLTVVTAALTTPYRPAAVAATPVLVPEDDLAAANAAESVIASTSYFAGPAIGAAVVALADPGTGFLVNGLTFALSALLLSRAGDLGGGRRPEPATPRAPADPRAVNPEASDPGAAGEVPPTGARAALGLIGHDIAAGATVVRRNPAVAALALFTSATVFQYGAEQVLHVFVATDRLGLDPSGVGLLSAAVGVGGLAMAPLTPRLGSGRSAGLLLGLAGVGMGATMALLAVASSLPVVLLLLGLGGIGAVVFEVLFITMLQRACPEESLPGVYGLVDSLTALTQLAGSAVAPLLLSGLGLGPALVVAGLVMVAVAVATAPALLRASQASDDERLRLAPLVARFRGLALFGDASQAALERIARASTNASVSAGEVVFREGDHADDLYLIVAGELDASVGGGAADQGVVVNRMTAGDWFGEIGLLRRVPRTATISAVTPGELVRIPGAVFLDALNTPDLLPDPLRRTMATRLQRTHPWLDPAPPVA